MPAAAQGPHPEFDLLADSWDMAMEADGYGAATRRGYGKALASFAAWLARHAPDVGPCEASGEHVRGWLVELRRTRAQNTARAYYAGVRHFYRFLVAEGEVERDPCEGIRSPSPGEPQTPVLPPGDLRRLLDTCAGRDFVARRDRAIILLFVDGGLRLAELAGLTVADVDVRERMVYVEGKGSSRSGRGTVRSRSASRPRRPWIATSASVAGTRGPRTTRCGSAPADAGR